MFEIWERYKKDINGIYVGYVLDISEICLLGVKLSCGDIVLD